MTRPRPKRGQPATPPPVTAKMLMEDLSLLYARIKQEEAAQDRAEARARRTRGRVQGRL